MANATIRIWWDASVEGYRISTPYNQGFVDTLKAAVPLAERMWDKESRLWTVSERAFPPIQQAIGLFFKGATINLITKAQTESASTPKAVTASPLDVVVLEFVKLLGFEAMQKAYRHAAMLNHPDRGGDMEKMTKINERWTRLERELWKTKQD